MATEGYIITTREQKTGNQQEPTRTTRRTSRHEPVTLGSQGQPTKAQQNQGRENCIPRPNLTQPTILGTLMAGMLLRA